LTLLLTELDRFDGIAVLARTNQLATNVFPGPRRK